MSRIWIRGSNVGVRIFAVGLLVLGLGAGLTAGFLKHQSADSLAVQEKAQAQPEATNLQTPPADTNEPQSLPAGAKMSQLRAQQAAQARAEALAKAKAQAKAEAARKAAKARADAAARAAAERASRKKTRPADPSGGPSGEAPPAAPKSCAQYSGNRRIGCSLLPGAGFPISQMGCLDKLFKKESNWTTTASNRSSGAYGIPQALPGRKMASFGADWKTNPVVQIKWGLSYIKGRYGNPCGAWNHSVRTGWY